MAAYFFDSTFQMVRTIPALALIPLVIVWFGVGEAGKIFLIALATFFPVYINTQHGVLSIDGKLLDEPFGALDAITRAEMQVLVEELWQELGITILLVTHDIDEALRLADRVILLLDGRIAEDVRVPSLRPRSRSHPEILAYRGRLEDALVK